MRLRIPFRSRGRWVIAVVFSLVALSVAAMVNWIGQSNAAGVYGENKYTDEDLGIQEIVSSYLADTGSYARYRTDEEASLVRQQESEWFEHIATGHDRERRWFELQLQVVLIAAGQKLPSHLGENGVLAGAFRDALDECAANAGYAEVRLYDDSNIDPQRLQSDGQALAAERDAEFRRYEREYGLDYELFVDLRHECHQYADDYPTLSTTERDKLLEELNEHYAAAIRRALSDHPEYAIPVEWHPGAPQPWADHLAENCLVAADGDQAILEECAAEFRIEIPDM